MIREVVKKDIIFRVEGNHDHWNSYEKNEWESDTFKILDSFLSPNDIMLDIGAWIGPISFYAASKIKKCYSLEPDPVAYKEFIANLTLNPHLNEKIIHFNIAMTIDGKPVKLFSRFNHGDSGSSLLKRVKSSNNVVIVNSTTFHQFILVNDINNINFIKMDIEGGEFFILPRIIDYLKIHRPTVLVSFHPSALSEYYELMFPFGFLRRLYRFFDPQKKIIKMLVVKKLKTIIKSMRFYNSYSNNLNPFKIENLKREELMSLDSILFSSSSPTPTT